MKRVIVVIMCVITIFLLSGCKEGQSSLTTKYSSEYIVPDISSLAKDTDSYDYFYVIDNNTGVVYLQFIGFRRAGITVALNADGTPVTVDQIAITKH